MANNGIPIGQWSGSDSIEKLHKTVIEIDKTTNRKTNLIIILTTISMAISIIGIICTR